MALQRHQRLHAQYAGVVDQQIDAARLPGRRHRLRPVPGMGHIPGHRLHPRAVRPERRSRLLQRPGARRVRRQTPAACRRRPPHHPEA
ncbi:hypothetical protein [Streptomyces sp. NPDC049915]|uniref:hypothetical protein n=1 Tax=Streptomyces sp. NPDC049915 TaxID=3155510 RepID=UPI00344ADD1E